NNASVNFEPIDSLVGNNEDYSYNFNVLDNISKDIDKDYPKFIYLDTVCKNMERHKKLWLIER
ncbi:MAG: hypothetical protein IJD90_00580, partial [Clostridia bacterium]|nr:hypothetical protein [Clostridia bacterium]